MPRGRPSARTAEQEPYLRFSRSADRALDVIERTDPAGYELVTATLHAALALPARSPVVPLRCRQACDGGTLGMAQAGEYAIVVAVAPSFGTVDVVGVLRPGE